MDIYTHICQERGATAEVSLLWSGKVPCQLQKAFMEYASG